MKAIRCAFLSLIVCLAFSHTAQAKVCDEVLYLAYNGNWRIKEGKFYPSSRSIESIPYHFGAICIDNVNKKLIFYPRSEHSYLKERAHEAVEYLNSKDHQEIWLSFREEYPTKGEGKASSRSTYFYAPKNTALFSYWAGEYIEQQVGRVIRRDVNAEPELDWVPRFTYSRLFIDMWFSDPYPSLEWTDSKGRSGP